jgi:hypothetical protein
MLKVLDLIQEESWDDAIRSSINGTLFHTRRFLSYHGDRFVTSERFVGFAGVKKGILARFSFIIENREGVRTLLSPYGASYGGLVFSRLPSYSEADGVAQALIALFQEFDVDEAYLTFPIAACCVAALDTATFALSHRGFILDSRDVTSIYKRGLSKPSERVRRSAAKARKLGVNLSWEPPLDDVWRVVDATYRKHGVPPTHTREDFAKLQELCSSDIRACAAYYDGKPAAALGLFRLTESVDSAFYICHDPELQQSQALSLLVLECLDQLPDSVSYFSFGTSTYYMQPRHNVFEFKDSFAKIGQYRETYLWRRCDQKR